MAGASLAYHLPKVGIKDVVLLEQGKWVHIFVGEIFVVLISTTEKNHEIEPLYGIFVVVCDIWLL